VLTGAAPPTSEVVWRFAMGATGLCALALGFFLAWQRPDKLTLVFFGICFSIAFFLREHPNITSAAWRYAHETFYTLFQWLLPAFVVHFFLLFPERRGSSRRRLLERLVYVPAGIVAVWLLVGATGAPGGDARAVEVVHSILATVYFVVYLALAVALFVRSYRRVRAPAMRTRLRAVVWGTVFGITPLVAAVVIMLLFPTHNPPGVRYSMLALALIPLSFAYAAFRHRIFDIEILVKRSVLYSILSALLLAIYFGVVVGLGDWLHERTGAGNPLLVLVSIVVMALVAAPARTRLQRFVDRVFFRERYDARATLLRFSHDLARMVELGGIATLLVQRVADLLDVETVALLLREESGRPFSPVRSVPETFDEHPELPATVETIFAYRRGVLQIEDGGGHSVLGRLSLDDRKALLAYQPSVLVPLRSRDTLLGLLILGPRRGAGWTSREDLEILETLGEQAAISLQNALLHRQALEKERMAQELAVAQGIQAQLVPTGDPRTGSIEFASSTVACHEIGGDFYDYVPLSAGELGVAIGDVSGKGVPAALMMAGLQSSFRTEAERGLQPSRVLESLNHRIMSSVGESNRFVCFFYGVLDLDGRQMTYANAGLDPPILVRGDGRVERLRRGGPILGVVPEPSFPEGKISLKSGDTLIFFTDGLVEPIENRTGLGEADLIRFLVRNRGESAGDLQARILERLREIVGEEPEDDTTFIVARAV
jgi:sigma-B regulation protein RsbU (phosphoserine phosphatase)